MTIVAAAGATSFRECAEFKTEPNRQTTSILLNKRFIRLSIAGLRQMELRVSGGCNIIYIYQYFGVVGQLILRTFKQR